MRISYVFWDFNGTLLNDVDICLNIMNTLLTEAGKEPITLEKYRNVFTFPVSEYYKRVGIINSDEEFDDIAHKWMDMYYEQEPNTGLYDDIIETLEFFKAKKINQGVLSASRVDQLQRLLKHVGIEAYMKDILGISDIYAKSKVHIGLDFIENSHLDPKEIVLIGDSCHDYEVASKMGINCILVANGHQSHEVLSTCGCLVVDKASDLCKLALWEEN